MYAVFLESDPHNEVKRGDLVGENPCCENGLGDSFHYELRIPNVDIFTVSTSPEICLECRTKCRLK